MKLRLILSFALIGTAGFAQNASTPSSAPANVPLRLVVPEDPVQLQPPRYEITASWNDKTKDSLSVPLTNTGDKTFNVLGVQATRGLFIVSYPDKVKAGGQGAINFIYDAADNTDGDMEVIRAKTDQGIKTIHVQIKRDAAVTFEAKELKWKVGGSADSKTVNLNIPNGVVTPRLVKVSPSSHKAEIEKVDGKNFKVKVTPASTAQATQFIVSIEFDQPLPGTAPIILCTVGN